MHSDYETFSIRKRAIKMKKLSLIILFIFTLSSSTLCAESDYDSAHELTLASRDAPYIGEPKHEVSMYIDEKTSLEKPKIKGENYIGPVLPDETVSTIHEADLFFYIKDEKSEIAEVSVIAEINGNELLGVRRSFVDYPVSIKSLALKAEELYGNATLKLTVKTKDNTSKTYIFHVDLPEAYIPIKLVPANDGKDYKLGSYGHDFEAIFITADNILGIADEKLIDDIKIMDENGINRYTKDSFILNTNYFLLGYDVFDINENFSITIPKGLFRVYSGLSEELVLKFSIPTPNIKEKDFLLNTYPADYSVVYLNDSIEKLDIKIDINKEFNIAIDKKIYISNYETEFVVNETDTSKQIVISIDAKANSHYTVAFEDGFIFSKTNMQSYRTKFEFDTLLRTDIDLPDDAVFTDVSPEHWAYSYISELTAKNIISGYQDGTFKPENSITRAELAKLLSIAFDLENENTIQYSDAIGHWAEKHISDLCNIASENSDNFRPDDFATREEVSVFIAKIKPSLPMKSNKTTDFFDYFEINETSLPYIEYALNAEIIFGYEDNTFRPQETIKRSEVSAIICRVMNML